jgi:hypothetical protein
MLVLLACGHERLEKDFMTEWIPLSEEQFGKFRQSPHIPGRGTEALSLWPSDLKTGCAETDFEF